MSGYRAVTRRIGLLAVPLVLLVGFAVYAYAQSQQAIQNANEHASFLRHARGNAPGVPEIAVGAGISAFVLAGGGLLLLADRLRGKKMSKS